jgi:hypothetical protein
MQHCCWCSSTIHPAFGGSWANVDVHPTSCIPGGNVWPRGLGVQAVSCTHAALVRGTSLLLWCCFWHHLYTPPPFSPSTHTCIPFWSLHSMLSSSTFTSIHTQYQSYVSFSSDSLRSPMFKSCLLDSQCVPFLLPKVVSYFSYILCPSFCTYFNGLWSHSILAIVYNVYRIECSWR